MVFIARYHSNPPSPLSRPLPACLYPPKGASAEYQTPPLTLTVPTRIPAANLAARPGAALNTVPDNPYGESLAIRRASASPSWAITVSTGPKISSRAGLASLSNPAMTVGSMKNPVSWSARRPPAAAGEGSALRDRQVQVALHPVALPRRNDWPAYGSGLVRVARLDRA